MNTQFSTFKFFTTPEKEEAWLDQMARQGWFLAKVSSYYNYTFDKGLPEKRSYKIDYRSFSKPQDREDYLALFTDCGWKPVMAKEVNMAHYFFNVQAEPRRDIFSDEVSRAGRNLRYALLSAGSILPALLPLLVVFLTGNLHFGSGAYLTPGLWQMSGREFLLHFLFETPFVVLRSSAWLLPLLPLGLMLIFFLRYYLAYRKAAKQQMT